jgi:hypothetical protein
MNDLFDEDDDLYATLFALTYTQHVAGKLPLPGLRDRMGRLEAAICADLQERNRRKGLCTCPCHLSPGMKHVVPCCDGGGFGRPGRSK